MFKKNIKNNKHVLNMYLTFRITKMHLTFKNNKMYLTFRITKMHLTFRITRICCIKNTIKTKMFRLLHRGTDTFLEYLLTRMHHCGMPDMYINIKKLI